MPNEAAQPHANFYLTHCEIKPGGLGLDAWLLRFTNYCSQDRMYCLCKHAHVWCACFGCACCTG